MAKPSRLAATRRLGLDAGEDGAKLPTPEAVPTSMPFARFMSAWPSGSPRRFSGN
jgi:hypothetical protein